MSRAVYLFCLARGGLVPPLSGTGIGGHEPLITKDFSDITAVVCEVPQEEFAGSTSEERLQDLGWVAPRAVRHEQVIEEVMRYSPVFPARFGTLFSSMERLAKLLELNDERVSRFLDYVADNEEWSVKGSLSKAQALEGILSIRLNEASESFSSLTPGVRYFKERQIRGEAEKELTNWVKTSCNAVADELIRCSTDYRQRKIINLSKDESEKETVVNWAFLVSRSHIRDFLARIDNANANGSARGLFFDCSGPWPPYTFSTSLRTEPEA